MSDLFEKIARDFDKKNEIPNVGTDVYDREVEWLIANGRLEEQYKVISHRLDTMSAENRKLKDEIKSLNDVSTQKEQATTSLIVELNNKIAVLEQSRNEWIYKATDYKSKCYELKQELKAASEKESDLPYEPIEVANYLINHQMHVDAVLFLPERDVNTFSVDELKQIAEHLLVYCEHNKEVEE